MIQPIYSPQEAAPWISATFRRNSAIAEEAEIHSSCCGSLNSVLPVGDHDWSLNGYPAPFTVAWNDPILGERELHLDCSEQWFMFRKAWRFGDEDMMRAILEPGLTPASYRALGRRVRNYNQEIWSGHSPHFTSGACLYYMHEALLFKFSQHPELAEQLLNTHFNVLAACIPANKVWGIGLPMRAHNGEINKRCHDPKQWKGENHLGFTLMDVRDILNWNGSAFDLKYSNLLSLLPQLEHTNPKSLHEWYQPPDPSSGVHAMGMVCYAPLANQWSQAIQSTPWISEYLCVLEQYGITPSMNLHELNYRTFDAEATQAMLMWIARMERFADGLIADALDNGMIVALMHHLHSLRDDPLPIRLP